MRGTYGSPLRLVFGGAAKLTAALVSEIEAQRWKKLIPEALEKVKKIAGELLEITGISALRGSSEAESEITGFHLIRAKIVRAGPIGGGILIMGAAETENELKVETTETLEPAQIANCQSLTSPGFANAKVDQVKMLGGEVNGNLLYLYNNNASGSAKKITLVHEAGPAEHENSRFGMTVDVVLEPQTGKLFVYFLNRWRPIQ